VRQPRAWTFVLGVGLVASALAPGPQDRARGDTGGGETLMPDPCSTALLVGYFEAFLDDRDVETFRSRVLARYTEGTLGRLAASGDPQARRSAVFALGLIGSIRANGMVARSLRDPDEIVRNLAQNALWAIWCRADSPENNAELGRVRVLIGQGDSQEAIDRATRLIRRAPDFAEAYNQRAIGYFGLGLYADSAADCRRTLERNPYHIGALSGLGKCYLELGLRREAISAFRRALELQPFDQDLRSAIEVLESTVE
jgi:tetratricopeptide (TPR) repeat protein